MKKITLIILSILMAASTAMAGSTSLQFLVPSPSGYYDSVIIKPEALPSGLCTPGAMRVNESTILQFCGESGTWGFLRGVFRQDGSTISLSDTTDTNYYFYMGPSGGVPDQGITIPKNGGIMAKGTYGTDPVLTTTGLGTRLIWYPRKSAFRAGSVDGTQWNDDNIGESSVAFGGDNMAYGVFSGVLSGEENIAGWVGDKWANSASVVAGGSLNQAKATISFIGAGSHNITEGAASVVVGGMQNKASGALSFIGGGGDQTMATWNTASGTASAIVGGTANTASGIYSAIGGGYTNIASASASTVAGGNSNQANGINSSVLGGSQNIAGGIAATVLGGSTNQANGYASITGGINLIVSGTRSIALGHPAALTTVSQSDAIVLYPQGNVGVGTTTPAYKLDVNGNGRFNGDLITTGSVGVGVAGPTQSLHISAAMRMEPLDSAPAKEDGLIYYSSSGTFCGCTGGTCYDMLGGATGGNCD